MKIPSISWEKDMIKVENHPQQPLYPKPSCTLFSYDHFLHVSYDHLPTCEKSSILHLLWQINNI